MTIPKDTIPGHPLTPKEKEALLYLCKGYQLKEIARFMGVTYHTVNTYLKSVYIKLDVSNRTECAYRAGKEGIV